MWDKRKVKITMINDRWGQLNVGESREGYEIKFDSKAMLRPAQARYWIECMEKRKPGNPTWILSGIWRADNTKFFIIGDYNLFWVFVIEVLRSVSPWKPGQPWPPEGNHVETLTSRAFLLSTEEAGRIKVDRIETDQGGQLSLLNTEELREIASKSSPSWTDEEMAKMSKAHGIRHGMTEY